MRNKVNKGNSRREGWSVFVAGAPTSLHFAIALSVYFDRPSWEAETLEVVQAYDLQKILSVLEMAQVALIIKVA